MYLDHLERVREGANNVYTLDNLSAYIEKYVMLEGKPYRFGDRYGFQATIINDTSRVTNTVKPAQIGLTTSTMAYICAATATQDKFNAIYSLPTSNDANKLVTTKLDPLIHGSPELKRLLDPDVDNSELKKIGDNFIFVRGSRSETAALSISADALVADEIDRSDPDTLKQFRSRLQASDKQIIKQFSTPTIDGVGISKEAQTSKRFRHMSKCNCCGYVWLPSYHSDIVIPGYSGALNEITKTTIKDIQWQQAHWMCPKCRRDPQLHPSRLKWVGENLQDNYEAHTYYITPVTACLVLLPAYLVRTSTEFNKRSEWHNQVLGETSEEENEQILVKDVDRAEIQADLSSSDLHFMGVDMGLMCAISIGRIHNDVLLVVHREMVPLVSFESRRMELIRQYKVVTSVHDVQPYVTEIMRICDFDQNAYGAIFTTSKSPELYTLQEKVEKPEEGRLNLRLLKVSRTRVLDTVRDRLKAGLVLMQKTDKSDNFKDHYTSMKRVQIFVKDELTFQWEKTDGDDHMLFSLAYLELACMLKGRLSGWVLPASVPLVKKFTLKENLQ